MMEYQSLQGSNKTTITDNNVQCRESSEKRRRTGTGTGTTTMTFSMVLAAVVFLLAQTSVSGAATPTSCPDSSRDPGLDELLYYSDLVLIGQVLKLYYPDPQNNATYTAEMDVFCIYKGANVPSHINITKAGKPTDGCVETMFVVGDNYLAYLKRGEGQSLMPAFKPSPATFKDELMIICDINITYPIGKSKEDASVIEVCGDDSDYPDYEYPDDTEFPEEECIPAFVPKKEVATTTAANDASNKENDDNNDGGDVDVSNTGNEVPYQSEKSENVDGSTDPNGSVAVRMSLVSLALAPLLVFMVL